MTCVILHQIFANAIPFGRKLQSLIMPGLLLKLPDAFPEAGNFDIIGDKHTGVRTRWQAASPATNVVASLRRAPRCRAAVLATARKSKWGYPCISIFRAGWGARRRPERRTGSRGLWPGAGHNIPRGNREIRRYYKAAEKKAERGLRPYASSFQTKPQTLRNAKRPPFG